MIQEPPPTDAPGPTPQTTRQRSPWRTGAVTFAVAALTDLAILGVATLSGADMAVTPPGGQTMTVGVGAILLALLVATSIGTVLLAFIGSARESRWRLMAAVGLAVGVLSLAAPLMAEATVVTKIALSCMHVAPALIWFVALRRPTTPRRNLDTRRTG